MYWSISFATIFHGQHFCFFFVMAAKLVARLLSQILTLRQFVCLCVFSRLILCFFFYFVLRHLLFSSVAPFYFGDAGNLANNSLKSGCDHRFSAVRGGPVLAHTYTNTGHRHSSAQTCWGSSLWWSFFPSKFDIVLNVLAYLEFAAETFWWMSFHFATRKYMYICSSKQTHIHIIHTKQYTCNLAIYYRKICTLRTY